METLQDFEEIGDFPPPREPLYASNVTVTDFPSLEGCCFQVPDGHPDPLDVIDSTSACSADTSVPSTALCPASSSFAQEPKASPAITAQFTKR